MPYITQDRRDALDPIVEQLVHKLSELQLDNFDEKNSTEGNVNYFVSQLLNRVYTPTSYKAINDVVGLLTCIKDEYYRKVAAPYEDQKEFDNGSVYEND
jgi:hypothetical protein